MILAPSTSYDVGLLASLRDGYLEEIGRLVRRVALVDSAVDGAARAGR